MESTADSSALYFSVADVDYPFIEAAFFDESGAEIELIDGLPGLEPESITVEWESAAAPPDFPASYGANLILSERARRAWSLESDDTVRLVPLHLETKSRTRLGYWWANVLHKVPILDKERSETTKAGPIYLRIDHFVVDWERVPGLDLFLCGENAKVVFRSRHVELATRAGLTGVHFLAVDGSKWPV